MEKGRILQPRQGRSLRGRQEAFFSLSHVYSLFHSFTPLLALLPASCLPSLLLQLLLTCWFTLLVPCFPCTFPPPRSFLNNSHKVPGTACGPREVSRDCMSQGPHRQGQGDCARSQARPESHPEVQDLLPRARSTGSQESTAMHLEFLQPNHRWARWS